MRGRKALWGFVLIVAASVVFVILLDFVFSIHKGRRKWELVASYAAVRIVYVDPRYAKDQEVFQDALDELVLGDELVMVLFFDNCEKTPTHLPMTDEQMLFWRAKYQLNPYTGYERFVFIEVVDPGASPPEIREIEADIRPKIRRERSEHAQGSLEAQGSRTKVVQRSCEFKSSLPS